MPFELDFISEKNFEEHVKNTIKTYNKSLEAIDLKKFNSNVIDPIKLTFDKNVFRKTEKFKKTGRIFKSKLGYKIRTVYQFNIKL